MTQMIKLNVLELNDRALDWAIDAALDFPKIDTSQFDSLTLEQIYEIAGKHEIEYEEKFWTKEDFLDAFNDLNNHLRQRSSDVAWVSRLISSEYISVTIGHVDLERMPVVQFWKARSLQDEINNNDNYQYGETKDLAALRCFVASKLGAQVEVPSSLTHVRKMTFK